MEKEPFVVYPPLRIPTLFVSIDGIYRFHQYRGEHAISFLPSRKYSNMTVGRRGALGKLNLHY